MPQLTWRNKHCWSRIRWKDSYCASNNADLICQFYLFVSLILIQRRPEQSQDLTHPVQFLIEWMHFIKKTNLIEILTEYLVISLSEVSRIVPLKFPALIHREVTEMTLCCLLFLRLCFSPQSRHANGRQCGFQCTRFCRHISCSFRHLYILGRMGCRKNLPENLP